MDFYWIRKMKIWIPQKNVMAPQTAMFIHKNGGSKLFQTG